MFKMAFLSGLLILLASCAPAAAPQATPQLTEKPPATSAPTVGVAKPTAAVIAPSPSPKPASDQPLYGGTLSLPSHSDPPNLDIHTNGTIALFAPISPVYSGVIQYGQDNKVVPDLAERWEVSPDGKAYTFNLRKGVKWQDGKNFISADAKFSLDRIMANEALKFILEAVDSVEAPDDSSLKVTLKYRQAGFLPLLGHGRALIAPKHVVDAKKDLKRDALGTGPFKLKEYLSGVSFQLEKNKEYFVPGRPYLDRVNFYIVKDVATRFAGFRAGRLHIYGHPPIHGEMGKSHVDTLKRDMPQATVRPYEIMRVYGLLPNWSRAPWNDVRVRRAAFLAVDRQKGLEMLSEGAGKLGISVFYGEWSLPQEELMKMPGFRSPKDQDVAEAKRLLAEAGYPQGFKSTVSVRAAVALMEKAATFMSDQLGKIGIELTIRIQEYAVWSEARSKLNYDSMLVEIPLPLADPDAAGRYISRKLGGLFVSSDDDQILDMLAKQSQAATTQERKEILYQLQRRTAEVVPQIVIGWENSFIALSPDVKNYTATGHVYSHNKLEEIWLAR